MARRRNMDTSRRPDRPIDSRPDRQLRHLQGLQLMTWLLSWIPSWSPARAPSPPSLTFAIARMQSWGAPDQGVGGRSRMAAPACLAAWSTRRAPRASGTDRSGARSGAARPARSYLCPCTTVNTVVPAQASDGAPTADLSPGMSRVRICSKGGRADAAAISVDTQEQPARQLYRPGADCHATAASSGSHGPERERC